MATSTTTLTDNSAGSPNNFSFYLTVGALLISVIATVGAIIYLPSYLKGGSEVDASDFFRSSTIPAELIVLSANVANGGEILTATTKAEESQLLSVVRYPLAGPPFSDLDQLLVQVAKVQGGTPPASLAERFLAAHLDPRRIKNQQPASLTIGGDTLPALSFEERDGLFMLLAIKQGSKELPSQGTVILAKRKKARVAAATVSSVTSLLK